MREIEINIDPLPTAAQVDAAAQQLGLLVTMKASLAKYPGCTHWHLKRATDPGTLEVTLWPQETRLWASIQDGRTGPWIDQAVRDLVEALGK